MKIRRDEPAVPTVLYRVDEAAAALRLSRSVLYELIRSGQLRTVKTRPSQIGSRCCSGGIRRISRACGVTTRRAQGDGSLGGEVPEFL